MSAVEIRFENLTVKKLIKSHAKTAQESVNTKKTPQCKALDKRTRKSTQVCKTKICVWTCEGWPNGFTSRLARQQILAINLCRLALGGQTVKTSVYLCPNLSSTKINASPHKSTQVGGQTKRKLNASPNLASTCESVWPGL